jgi:uncharacterized membrane-anchored protein
VGDFVSQPDEFGGLGLGTLTTSAAFLAIIAATVAVMTRQSRSRT